MSISNLDLSNCLPLELSPLLQELKQLDTRYFFWQNSSLANKLEKTDPIDLTKALQGFFLEIGEVDPALFLNRLATILPLTKVLEITQTDVDSTLKKARDLFDEAKLYLEITQKPLLTFEAHFLSILEKMTEIAESIRSVFSEEEQQLKSQKVVLLMSLFSMLTATIIPLLQAAVGELFLGGVFLCLIALSALLLSKKSIPQLPSYAENWTRESKLRDFPIYGRKSSLDAIAFIFKMNRHALLVGPSKVGKTTTAKAFGDALKRGDFPELKEKAVFCINAENLQEKGTELLSRISIAMGESRGDIIIVLDDIHKLYKNKKMAEQLNGFLEEGGKFPHVIGIISQEEYSQLSQDPHLISLRFEKVNITNTSRDETLKILSDIALRNRCLIQDGALTFLYTTSQKKPSAPEPISSIHLLKTCINLTQKTEKSETEKKTMTLTNQILSMRTSNLACPSAKKETSIQIEKLEKNLKELQEILNKEKVNIEKLFQSKKLLDCVTKETYLLALKVDSFSKEALSPKNENTLKTFSLLHFFLNPLLRSYIQEKSSELGLKTMINEALIKEATT